MCLHNFHGSLIKGLPSIFHIRLMCNSSALDHSFTWCLASKTRISNISFLRCAGRHHKHDFYEKRSSRSLYFLIILPDSQPAIVDEKGRELEGECSGYLCIKKSWPGAFRTLYGDKDRYETTYFKPFAGYYFSGDGCSRYRIICLLTQ